MSVSSDNRPNLEKHGLSVSIAFLVGVVTIPFPGGIAWLVRWDAVSTRSSCSVSIACRYCFTSLCCTSVDVSCLAFRLLQLNDSSSIQVIRKHSYACHQLIVTEYRILLLASKVFLSAASILSAFLCLVVKTHLPLQKSWNPSKTLHERAPPFYFCMRQTCR